MNIGPCPGTSYNTQFSTKVSPDWTTLVARSAPCQSGTTVTGSYSTGQTMNVSKESDNAQFICRGRSYGYGTDVWYYTYKGWSWAGGTTFPQWDWGTANPTTLWREPAPTEVLPGTRPGAIRAVALHFS